MLVEMSAVEICQAMRVGREVRRHPVEDYGDPTLVQVIEQITEVLRGSVGRGWRKVAGGLISPRAVEGMFHHRQEFNVGEAHAFHVIREARRGLAIGQRTVMFFRYTHP